MLKIPMVMVLHTFQNTMDSRLGSFGMTAGRLVPINCFYKDAEATKGSKSYVSQLIMKGMFWTRQIQPCTSSYAEFSN